MGRKEELFRARASVVVLLERVCLLHGVILASFDRHRGIAILLR